MDEIEGKGSLVEAGQESWRLIAAARAAIAAGRGRCSNAAAGRCLPRHGGLLLLVGLLLLLLLLLLKPPWLQQHQGPLRQGGGAQPQRLRPRHSDCARRERTAAAQPQHAHALLASRES